MPSDSDSSRRLRLPSKRPQTQPRDACLVYVVVVSRNVQTVTSAPGGQAIWKRGFAHCHDVATATCCAHEWAFSSISCVCGNHCARRDSVCCLSRGFCDGTDDCCHCSACGYRSRCWHQNHPADSNGSDCGLRTAPPNSDSATLQHFCHHRYLFFLTCFRFHGGDLDSDHCGRPLGPSPPAQRQTMGQC